MADYSQAMLSLVNQERAYLLLCPLKLNNRLSQTAQKHSLHQASNNDIYHEHKETGGFVDRIIRDWPECKYEIAAENVGLVRPSSIPEMHRLLMESPGHRENILGREFEEIGLGFHLTKDNTVFCTQLFIKFRFEHHVAQLLHAVNNERRRRLATMLSDEREIQAWSYVKKQQRKKELRQVMDYQFPVRYPSISDIPISTLLNPRFRYLHVCYADSSHSNDVMVDCY